jgi:hypothetical protein
MDQPSASFRRLVDSVAQQLEQVDRLLVVVAEQLQFSVALSHNPKHHQRLQVQPTHCSHDTHHDGDDIRQPLQMKQLTLRKGLQQSFSYLTPIKYL